MIKSRGRGKLSSRFAAQSDLGNSESEWVLSALTPLKEPGGVVYTDGVFPRPYPQKADASMLLKNPRRTKMLPGFTVWESPARSMMTDFRNTPGRFDDLRRSLK